MSYRREDAAAYAGRLCDHLKGIIGDQRVFMDVDDIAPGESFARRIDETMAGCDIALIVIGPRWAEILRQRAQQSQPDYVAHEIETALKRGIRTTPVLVGGATMNELAGVPSGISALAQFEAAELRDSTFSEDCARLARSLGLRKGVAGRSRLMLAGAAVLAALILAGGALGVRPWKQPDGRKAGVSQALATARSQASMGEYEAAFHTAGGLLATAPLNRAAQELQAKVAMEWLEDFHVIGADGSGREAQAGRWLDEILPVLHAELARAKGPQARADLMAHIGWAHWLNAKLAERESSEGAEAPLREALKIDPSNVFAHAMLGNWLMQTHGSTAEALDHFRKAVDGNRSRPLVRRMQLGVLVYPGSTEARTALIRLADEMRRNGETIDNSSRSRILSEYSPMKSGEELSETLSAVPPDESWATFLWLDAGNSDRSPEDQRILHSFIHGRLLELQGKREEALQELKPLQTELTKRGRSGSLLTQVNQAIARLTSR